MSKASLLSKLAPPASLDSDHIQLGDSATDRLFLPGLKLDTDSAQTNQVLTWNDTTKTLSFKSPAAGTDSNAIISLIDSSYVQSRQTTGGGGSGTVDSAQTITLISNTVDSAYVNARAAQAGIASGGINSFDFDATQGQTVFSGNDKHGNALVFAYEPNVYLNGAILRKTEDYTSNLSSNTITLVFAAAAGDEITIQAYEPTSAFNMAQYFDSAFVQSRTKTVFPGNRNIETFRYVSNASQVIYEGADANGNTLSYDHVSGVQVNVNGILLTSGNDYVGNAGLNRITLQDSVPAGSEIIIQDFRSRFVHRFEDIVDSSYVTSRIPSFTDSRGIERYKFTTTGPQSVFTGTDSAGNTLSLGTSNYLVFLNGVNLDEGPDFTVNGAKDTITLTPAADSNFELVVYDWDKRFSHTLQLDSARTLSMIEANYPVQASLPSFKYTATAGQTTFTGGDSSGATLAYGVGGVMVFLNGIALDDTDFTATNGTSIVLSPGATAGDNVVIKNFKYNLNGGNVNNIQAVVNTAYIQERVDTFVEVSSTPITAVNRQTLIVDTTTPKSIALPTGSFGNKIKIVDGSGTAATNNITVSSSQKIRGSDSDLIIDIDESIVALVYYNATRGWIITEK